MNDGDQRWKERLRGRVDVRDEHVPAVAELQHRSQVLADSLRHQEVLVAVRIEERAVRLHGADGDTGDEQDYGEPRASQERHVRRNPAVSAMR
jgi:hypothetical protein